MIRRMPSRSVATEVTSQVGLAYSYTPPPVLPEAPAVVLLPLSAAALCGGAFVLLRRRCPHTA